MIGTKVLGWRCCIYEEELLGPSNSSYSLPHLQPRGPVKPLHVDLFQDFAGDCSCQEVLCILIGTLTLQLQGLELGQEVIDPLVGALMKTQELGPCPPLIVPWEEEGLDLHL